VIYLKEFDMFHLIADSTVVLKSRGVYKQSQCYSHKGQIFAKHGSGFIKLFKHNNGTSTPNVSWDEVQLPYEIEFGTTGVMVEQQAKPHLVAVA
jgi:hypothetical protein